MNFCFRGSILAVTFALAAVAHCQAPETQRACRSVHLWWSNQDVETREALAFCNELTIDASAKGSSFMACGFSKGYFGLQELANGKKVALFSVLEPGAQDTPNTTPKERRVRALANGENVRVKRFDGEETGGQAFFDYPWEIGESVRFVVYAKPDGSERTQYAGYVYLPHENRWQHMATFSTRADGELLRDYYSFVEDFRREGESAQVARRARYGNGWVRLPSDDGQRWVSLDRARFTVDNAAVDNAAVDNAAADDSAADNATSSNVDSGTDYDRFYLHTGGATKNDATQPNSTTSLAKQERRPPVDLPQPFSTTTSPAAERVRVLAYNIKHGRGNDGRVDLARIAAVIRRLNPDVVALQEIDNECQRSGNVNEAEALSNLTGLPYHAFGKFFDFQNGEYGMAILSRYPIEDTENLRLPDGAEARTSLITTVNAAKPFRLASVHFYATEAERMAQAKTLLSHLGKRHDVPTVVAGDFNSKPPSSVLQLFGDWQIPSKGEDRLTFSSDKPRIEIDYIMFHPRDAFEVNQIEVIAEPVASDHRPLLLDLR